MRLHYAIEGPAHGPALLLINGLLADLNSWSAALPLLAGFRVLRFDAIGQGLSPKPDWPSYGLDAQIDALLALLDERDWPRCHVVGLSHGGALAMALALRAPQRLRSLVLAGCLDRLDVLEKLKIETWLHAHLAGGGAHRFAVAAPWIWSRAFVANHGELLNGYRERAAAAPPHAVTALIRSALEVDLEVAGLDLPALVLAADEDLLTPLAQMTAMARRLPRARLTVISGAHAALLEQPQLFADHLIPFWREVDDVA